MVIATDMSTHFQQVKTLKTLLSHAEFSVDKQKGLSYILHSADISHPSKMFPLHQRWTLLLMEEFFRQVNLECYKFLTTATYSAMLVHRQLNEYVGGDVVMHDCGRFAVISPFVCLHLPKCIKS